MKPEIIVALDGYKTESDLMRVVESLSDSNVILKIGKESHVRFGTSLVDNLVSKGHKVFLDLKLHDIPNTVAATVDALIDTGVWMTNLHCSGGKKIMDAAVEAVAKRNLRDDEKPLLIGVTVLTSFQGTELRTVGIVNSIGGQVSSLARMAYDSGLDGVVCSPLEVPVIKSIDSEFIAVTPGVRWKEGDYDAPYSGGDDQARVLTPRQAQEAGSDYLVIGRPITQHPDPSFVVACLTDILDDSEPESFDNESSDDGLDEAEDSVFSEGAESALETITEALEDDSVIIDNGSYDSFEIENSVDDYDSSDSDDSDD